MWWGSGSTYSFRELFRYTYLTRGRYRVVRRSLEDSLKLASLARELAQVYLEVVEWGERRVLRLRS
ncbi:MAG: hypothetical protein LM571_02910 [Desulfurococcaceae archaeon]|nr:hypothetical protein [Desulfurococcaceae archaeon]